MLGLFLLGACSGGGSSGSDTASGTGGQGGSPENGGGRDAGAGGAGAGSCASLSPAGGTVSWLDNGTPECASVVQTTRAIPPGMDFIDILASAADGSSMEIVVSVASPARLSGSYACNGTGTIVTELIYTTPASFVAQSCTIEFANPGEPGVANAKGTFSATLLGGNGLTKAITNGSFDTPVIRIDQ
ncbi:MAG TPA: hypothetical protein VHM31_14455 [Polyangia bacterium]|nr:hypothetical protein [Polyangia bacterium]